VACASAADAGALLGALALPHGAALLLELHARSAAAASLASLGASQPAAAAALLLEVAAQDSGGGGGAPGAMVQLVLVLADPAARAAILGRLPDAEQALCLSAMGPAVRRRTLDAMGVPRDATGAKAARALGKGGDGSGAIEAFVAAGAAGRARALADLPGSAFVPHPSFATPGGALVAAGEAGHARDQADLLLALPGAADRAACLLRLPTAAAAAALVELKLRGDFASDVLGAMGKGGSAAVRLELESGGAGGRGSLKGSAAGTHAGPGGLLRAAKGMPKALARDLVLCTR